MPDTNLNPDTQSKIDQITSNFNKKVQEIEEQYQPKKEQIEEDYPNPEDWEAALGADIVINWVDTSLKFDLPEFTMNTQAMSFDLPSVTMNTQTVSFDVPETYMETSCVTKVPKWYGPFTVKMECIYMDIPKVRSRRIEIKLDVPEITSNRVDWQFDIPEVTMKTTEIIMSLPQITVREVSVTIAQKQEAYGALATEMSRDINNEQVLMQSRMKSEVFLPMANVISEKRAEMMVKRDEISKSFDLPIKLMKNTINTLKENNAVEKVAELEAKLSTLVTDYQRAISEIDKAINQLSEQEKIIFEKY